MGVDRPTTLLSCPQWYPALLPTFANPSLMHDSKWRQVAWLWVLALGFSALLVAAGRHWPEPLVITPRSIWLLVLAPPAAMALWLAGRWTLPPGGEGGESSSGSQSIHSQQERH
jgi:hypothetical protein